MPYRYTIGTKSCLQRAETPRAVDEMKMPGRQGGSLPVSAEQRTGITEILHQKNDGLNN